jgi:FKBP-type peptidyl-prolyl cis-trans isomerase
MKPTICLLLLAIATPAGAEETALKSPEDRTSYAVGVQTGRTLRQDDVKVNEEALVRGLRDGLSNGRTAVPERELQKILGDFQQELRQKMMANRVIAAAENRKKAEEFLKQNKDRPGVIQLASGVQYKIIKAGDGPVPKDADTVICNYRGTTLDGAEFDATEDGKPAGLQLDAVIPGWREALKLMPAGSHWQLFIPSALAYGERGVGASIGPNQALIFDVELVSIKPGH